MKLFLVYPPACDPTAPYLALASLAAFLRGHGIEVELIDANLEGFLWLLSPSKVAYYGELVRERLWFLNRKPSLTHAEQVQYLRLYQAWQAMVDRPVSVAQALRTFRDKELFYDPLRYQQAVVGIEAALGLVSAAYAPLELSFAGYRTPFSLLNMHEVAHDARAEHNPFHDYFTGELVSRFARDKAQLVGLSVCFPGQIQPAYSLAMAIKAQLPECQVLGGGPALTQLFDRLGPDAQKLILGPFDAIVLNEGERALLRIIGQREKGVRVRGVIRGEAESFEHLPAPDFEGLPLERYLSPELVVPYDPSRGCYWGRCAFCHYGLSTCGPAGYRGRTIDQVLEHLQRLQTRYHNRVFYFSQDMLAPAAAVELAQALIKSGLAIRWSGDMRAEPFFTSQRSRILYEGGALSFALGVESAAPRVLKRIDKGITVAHLSRVITDLSQAGLAVEVMAFRDFPGETYAEARQTIAFIRDRTARIALFHLGTFGLVSGSRVAQDPRRYGLSEIWQVKGDELGLGLFYRERSRSKSSLEQDRLDHEIQILSEAWWLNHYPWAGAVSTAHSLLYYQYFGPAAFKTMNPGQRPVPPKHRKQDHFVPRFDPVRLEDTVAANEAKIWQTMIQQEREVSRDLYQRLLARFVKEERQDKSTG
ncbi:radical SAM protein [bacterium]|nr:radical SAM protein [bacterium]